MFLTQDKICKSAAPVNTDIPKLNVLKLNERIFDHIIVKTQDSITVSRQ